MSVNASEPTRTGLPFTKYQGAGNDFVILDARPGRGLPAAETVDWVVVATRACDRHFGIGADGLLIALAPEHPSANLRMRMLNPDGTEAELCGNGLRCFARWLYDRGEIGHDRITIETGAGLLGAQVEPDGQVQVEMGTPRLRPEEIPLSGEALAGQPAEGPVLDLAIPLAGSAAAGEAPGRLPAGDTGGTVLHATCLSMGNPHAVIFVPEVDAVPLERWGPALERHPWFPARTNVEFCQVLDRGRLRARIWERGAGATLACGSGVCAAAVAARLRGLAGERVVVEVPGGQLEIRWEGPVEVPAGRAPRLPGVVLRGPAARVFDGRWYLTLPPAPSLAAPSP